MQHFNVIALRAFDYNGQPRAEGEVFETPALDAVVLINRRLVRLDPTRPRTTAAAPKPKRQYRRRDLVAEGS